MAKEEFFTTLKVASEKLGYDEQPLRELAKRGKLTFATAIPNKKGNGYRYFVDVHTLYKCVKGEKELFRA